MSAAIALPVLAPAPAPAPATAHVRCAKCGHGIEVDAWRRLPRVQTLSGAELAPHVHAWPADMVIEVRACPRCAVPIARRAPAR